MLKRWMIRSATAMLGLFAPITAACGSDAETTQTTAVVTSMTGPTTEARTGESTVAGSAAPETGDAVTIEHRFGSTVVSGRPTRIVSLDTQWTDVLLGLEAPMIGYLSDPNVDGGTFPWQAGLLDGIEPLEGDAGIPFEAIAALKPDLIVVTYLLESASDYDLLTAIAPTIPLLSESEQVDPWQELATAAGQVLGKADEAAALVAAAEQRSADVVAELPGLDGKTFALANYVPGDALYVVADPEDGSSLFFAQLGLSIDPDILAIADGVSGRATLSLEQVSILDADLLVMFTNGADPADVPGFSALPAVQSGAVATLDYAAVVGLNTPTPLSIPYSLELIRPALEAAAG